MKRGGARVLTTGEPVEFTAKPWTRTLVVGSVLFGAGWGLAGACPGTVLAMLGEGKLTAGFTIVGILLGTWLFGVQQDWLARRAASRTAGPAQKAARG